jgi:hypothetical protein
VVSVLLNILPSRRIFLHQYPLVSLLSEDVIYHWSILLPVINIVYCHLKNKLGLNSFSFFLTEKENVEIWPVSSVICLCLLEFHRTDAYFYYIEIAPLRLEVGGRKGTQKTCTHVSKCKNDKIK